MSELIDREATVKQICKMGEMVGGHDRDVVISIALFVQDDKTAFPTVERPHVEWKTESAIDYLTEIGWLPEHDRILTERPQWIPCSERLPEKNGVYLVTGENGHVFEYDYSDFTTHNEKWSYCRNEIVAWMPLPEPYKRGERNEM